MAFTGSAVIKQISDRLVRVTGLTLGAGAAGTIGLDGATGSTPGVRLPAAFQPKDYTYGGAHVAFQDSIDVEINIAATAVTGFAPIVAVVKSGTTEADFRATLTNTGASESPGLEFYVRFHE